MDRRDHPTQRGLSPVNLDGGPSAERAVLRGTGGAAQDAGPGGWAAGGGHAAAATREAQAEAERERRAPELAAEEEVCHTEPEPVMAPARPAVGRRGTRRRWCR